MMNPDNIDTIEKLLQDYASYSFMEGTIDENTKNHLVEDAQNYVAKLNEANLLSLHLDKTSFCKCNCQGSEINCSN